MSSQKPPKAAAEQGVQRLCAGLFVATQPLSRQQLCEVCGVDVVQLDNIMERASLRLADIGLLMVEDEIGVMLSIAADIRKHLAGYFAAHAPALSSAAMEVLTLVAYNQPISKSRIDELRGVVSDASVKTLLTRGLIRADRAKAAEPLYITTPQFLSLVGIRSLADLPKAPGVRRAAE